MEYKLEGKFIGTVKEISKIEEEKTAGGYNSAVRTGKGNATGGDNSVVGTRKGDATGGNYSICMGTSISVGKESVGVVLDDSGSIIEVYINTSNNDMKIVVDSKDRLKSK